MRTSGMSNKTFHELKVVNRIEWLDVTPTFKVYRGPDSLYFSYDIHWTLTGHLVMAKDLGYYLMVRYPQTWRQ
jgi:hypothetical protein